MPPVTPTFDDATRRCIGARVREERAARGWSTSETAARIWPKDTWSGIGGRVSSVEGGRTKSLDEAELALYAGAFGVTSDSLRAPITAERAAELAAIREVWEAPLRAAALAQAEAAAARHQEFIGTGRYAWFDVSEYGRRGRIAADLRIPLKRTRAALQALKEALVDAPAVYRRGGLGSAYQPLFQPWTSADRIRHAKSLREALTTDRRDGDPFLFEPSGEFAGIYIKRVPIVELLWLCDVLAPFAEPDALVEEIDMTHARPDAVIHYTVANGALVRHLGDAPRPAYPRLRTPWTQPASELEPAPTDEEVVSVWGPAPATANTNVRRAAFWLAGLTVAEVGAITNAFRDAGGNALIGAEWGDPFAAAADSWDDTEDDALDGDYGRAWRRLRAAMGPQEVARARAIPEPYRNAAIARCRKHRIAWDLRTADAALATWFILVWVADRTKRPAGDPARISPVDFAILAAPFVGVGLPVG